MRVENASYATLLFDARTSFSGWDKHPVLEGKPYVEPCLRNLDTRARQPYAAMRNEHIADQPGPHQSHEEIYRSHLILFEQCCRQAIEEMA